MSPFESWRCQTCGAEIGWLGRAFQSVIGCTLVSVCGAREAQNAIKRMDDKPISKEEWARRLAADFANITD